MERGGWMELDKLGLVRLEIVGVIVLATLLAACGGGGGDSSAPDRGSNAPTITINGQALLREQPLDGARVTLSRLDVTQTQATENVKGKVITVDIPDQQPVVGANGSISFQVGAALVQDDQLFSVAIACTPVSEHCPLQMPLHAVMSGARLKQGSWTANIATEIAYQRLAYYVAARFGESDLKLEMDTTAKLLMRTDVDGSGGIDYEDILQWNPVVDVESAALLRPQMMTDAAGLLKDGAGANAVQAAAQALTSPLLGRVALQGEGVNDGINVRVSGHHAFVQTFSSGVQIFDVSDPSQPVFVNMLEQYRVLDFVVSERFAYTITTTFLSVIDVTDPANPRHHGSVRSPYATSVQIQVADSRAFVCSGSNGIQIVDLTNPAAPALGDRLEVNCKKLEVAGQYAYVVTPVSTDVDAVLVFDIGQAGMPVQVATLENAGRVRAIKVQGQHVYVAEYLENRQLANQLELAIFDIGQPANPSLVSRYHLPVDIYLDIQVDGRYLYLLQGSGISIVDIGDPARPELLSITNIGPDTRFPFGYTGMAIAGGIAFIARREWLEAFNLVSLDAPLSGSVRTEAVPLMVVVDQEKLYYTTKESVHIRDVSNPVLPGAASSISNGTDSQGTIPRIFSLWSTGDHLYWCNQLVSDSPIDSMGEISAIDTTVSMAQSEVLEVTLPDSVIWDIELANGVAHIGGQSGLTIAELDNPLSPIILSRLELGEPVMIVALSGHYAYLRLQERLLIVDLVDMSEPRMAGSLSVGTQSFTFGGLAVSGNYAYFAADLEDMLVVDVRNADAPEIVKRIHLGGFMHWISVVGTYAYVLTGGNFVHVLDISDPVDPTVIGVLRLKGHAGAIAFGPTHMYLATNYGIEILPLLPEN